MRPLAFFVAVLLMIASAARAAENRNLEEARKRVEKQQWTEALEELQAAEQLPGNTNRHRAGIAALRASALLGLPPSPERTQQAREQLVQLVHLDPDGAVLAATATAAARALAQELRAERALVLHEHLATVRTGRPIRVRARLAGAIVGTPRLFLNYGIEGTTEEGDWIRVPMDRGEQGYEAWLRPGVGGMPSGGEHVLRYYIEAVGPGGTVLDSNGTARDPIRAQLSETLPETTGLAALDEGGRIAHPPPPPPPPTPWYKRWEIVGPVGGAIIVGGVIAAVLLQPKPQAMPGSLGRVDLP
jgi:hypothetical protein